jgi:hypothetical protein
MIFTRVVQVVLQHHILNKRKCAHKGTTQDASSLFFNDKTYSIYLLAATILK